MKGSAFFAGIIKMIVQLDKLPGYILILVLALASFAVFANSLHGDFLIDDHAAILANESIHNYKTYFSGYFKIRPGVLEELRRVFIWHISGDNPFLYHLVNVLAHAANVILLFLLFNILFNNKALSFLSSLIFALHPIHTEAISWISGAPYVFSSLFFLAALIFYIKSGRSIFYLCLAVIFFGLCLFIGNSVAALPGVFIMYELFFSPRQDKNLKIIRILVLSLILVLAATFVIAVYLSRDKFVHTIFYFRGLSYLIVIAKALVYYLKILYLPIQRGLYHAFAYNTTDTGKVSPAFFASIAVIIICIYLFFRCLKNARPLAFGIAFFFITYLPYSNIVPVCNIISERYMYLPSAGFALILAYLFLKIWQIINNNINHRAILRYLAITAMTLFLGSYSILTLKHNIEYSNLITYWTTNIQNFPDGYMAYNNLAGTFYATGDRRQAIGYSWVNLMINPQQPHVWCNLGRVYREIGDLKWAGYCYEAALKVDPNYSPARKALDEMNNKIKR